MKNKDNYIKVCPKCGSTTIGIITTGGIGNIGVHLEEYCKKCNYGFPSGGHFFPEVEKSKVKIFRKQLKIRR